MMHFRIKSRKWLVAVMLLLLPPSLGIGGGVTPEKVRASFILQMQKFVTIGTSAQKPQKICFYEKPGIPMEESTGQLLQAYAKTHPAAGISVKKYEAIRDFSDCDIFYIPASEETNVDNILAAIGSAPTLTISTTKRFIYRGGMIGFVLDNENRVKMEANLKNIRQKSVTIDAQLLEIMQHVEQL